MRRAGGEENGISGPSGLSQETQNPEEERVPYCQPLAEPGLGLGAARGLQSTSADQGGGGDRSHEGMEGEQPGT